MSWINWQILIKLGEKSNKKLGNEMNSDDKSWCETQSILLEGVKHFVLLIHSHCIKALSKRKIVFGIEISQKNISISLFYKYLPNH